MGDRDLAAKAVRLLIEMFTGDHPEHAGGLRTERGGLFVTDAARPVFVAWAANLKGCSPAEVERTFGLGPAPASPTMTSFLGETLTPEQREEAGWRELVAAFLADCPEHAGGVKWETVDGRTEVLMRPEVGAAYAAWAAGRGLIEPDDGLRLLHEMQNQDRPGRPDAGGTWPGRH